MGFYSIWPAAAALAATLMLVGTNPFAAADSPPHDRPARLTTLDGLRGIVAVAVVLHHAVIYHVYLRDGVWTLPPSAFYAALGRGGVGLFFMVTGYLFWSRVLRERGRLSWARFAVGRVFRIGPVYLVAVLAMLLVVFASTGPHLAVSGPQLNRQLGRWLSLGWCDVDSVNGYPVPSLLVAGVTWTLHYEWLFYFSLPALALAARWPRLALPATVAAFALACVWLWRGGPLVDSAVEPVAAVLFGCGMLSAALHARGWGRAFPEPFASVGVALLLASVVALFPDAFGLPAILALGLAFHLIASGCSVFGLLTRRATRRLGNISYGVYLLQGLALAAVLRAPGVRALALASPVAHWAATLAALALLVAAATVVHVWVERPGIALGQRVSAGRRPKLDTALAPRL